MRSILCHFLAAIITIAQARTQDDLEDQVGLFNHDTSAQDGTNSSVRAGCIWTPERIYKVFEIRSHLYWNRDSRTNLWQTSRRSIEHYKHLILRQPSDCSSGVR